MAGESTTRLQISGHRFLMRRMAHALVRGDVRMLDDPLRAQSLSLIVGCVVAVIAVAVCAVLAFLSPKGSIGTAAIVLERESGALYVRVGDTLHPVLNLASARLLTGSTDKPELVSAAAVDKAVRGPLLGIPGAPDTIARPLDESVWAVCDDASAMTTVIAGTPREELDGRRSVLVSARGESAATTYLLYDGVRARVDLRHPAVVRALRLDGVAPQLVSRALLDALPEAPPITVPAIPAGPSMLRGFEAGTVVRLDRAGFTEYYVLLPAGVQRIGEATADLIRFAGSTGRRDIATVAPAAIGRLPVVDALPVATYPERGGVTTGPVLCAQWAWSDGAVNTAVHIGDSLPSGDVLPRGRSAFVRAVGVSGDGASGPLYFVDDTGVAFGVSDDDAAQRLGLTGQPLPAPWPVLARLPRGPALSVQAASVARDASPSPPPAQP